MKSKQVQEFKETEIGKIPVDWNYEILDNFLERITYGFTCPMPTSNDGPYMITAADLKNNKINFETARKTTLDAFDNSLTDKSRPKINDILLSKDGTLGRVAIVNEEKICINQSVALLQPNTRVFPNFLYYLLLTPVYQKKMISDSDGTAIQHIYITRVNKMHVGIPEINEQKRIAQYISKIDTKIQNLQNQNRILEQTAQVIFKSWFVDFDGVTEFEDSELGKIPKGWKAESLDQNINFLNGLALQKFRPMTEEFLPVIKIKEMNEGFSNKTDKAGLHIDPKYIVKNGDVLFSWSGSLELMLWYHGDGALNQHLFKVTSEKFMSWFFYQWINFHLSQFRRIAAGKRTTMGHIQRHHLAEAKILVPPPEILEKHNSFFQPMIDQILSNKLESESLTQTRDTLIPKLMSGEIRV